MAADAPAVDFASSPAQSTEDTNKPVRARGADIARWVFRLAGLLTFLTAAMGSLVSTTESGAACPTWPGCFPGDVAPPAELSPIIEFTHRVVAITAGALILAAALLAGRLARPDRWVRVLPWVALAGAATAGSVGRAIVLGRVPAYVGAIDLFCALAAMTMMGAAAILATRTAKSTVPAETRARRIVGSTSAFATGVLLVMHAFGLLVASPGSYSANVGWPLWGIVDTDLHPGLQVVRMVLAGLALGLATTAALAAMASRLRPGFGATVISLLVAELVLGVLIRTQGLSTGMAVAHSIVAVALLFSLALLAAAPPLVDQGRIRRT